MTHVIAPFEIDLPLVSFLLYKNESINALIYLNWVIRIVWLT